MDELEDVLVRYRPKLIYTNPTFQNPTGVTMPIRARPEAAAGRALPRADRRGRDYRGLLNEAPPPSLRELDAQNIVIYLNSFSKVLAPGLRLGWLSAAPSIIDQIAIIKQRLDPHTQNLGQFAMARLIRDGNFDTHLRTLRSEHARRCAMMIASIQRHVPPGALRFARPQGGLYLWCRVRPA
jgi:DNA-binding transcriptional MocR family regulator